MAITSNTYTGNGSNKLFSITFPYIDTTDVDVYLNGVLQTVTTQYTFANATTVEFVAAPGAGTTVLLNRSSDDTTLQATFFPGSSIKSADLNDNFDQVLYLAQETNNNVANAVAGQIPDGTITSAKIADGAIVNADVNASAGIVATKLAFTQAGTGATVRTVDSKLKETVSVEDFGADPTGVNDCSQAITNAVAYCQANNLQTLYFGPGIFKLTQTVTLGLPRGISLVGQINATSQQGSSRSATTLRWAGGASPMFEINYTFFRFYNFTVENTTTATEFVLANSAMCMEFDHVDVTSGASGPTTFQFSNAVIRGTSNQFGYSVWRHCQVASAAPSFVEINGNGASNGTTTLRFYNNIFEAGANYSMTVLKLIDNSTDIVSFQDNTFNQQGNVSTAGELCIIDTLGFDTDEISCLNIIGNEFDYTTTQATHRAFKLKNVRNSNFIGNQFIMGGTMSAVINLVNSTITNFSGNYGERINGPIINADSTSKVWVGSNNISLTNTLGVVNNGTAIGIVNVTYGTSVGISGNLAPTNSLTVFQINVTNGNAWDIFPRFPSDATPGYMTKGQIIALQIRNISGGAIGAISAINASNWKLSAPLPTPANGYSRTVVVMWDGSAFIELSRTAADVPN
jgi:hypothetical protein